MTSTTPRLPQSLHAWPTPGFARSLKRGIEALGAGALPLEQAIEPGSRVGGGPITVTVLRAADAGDAIVARVGVFFAETVGSCGCGAEPMEQNACCVMRVRIDKATAEAAFAVVDE